MERKYLNSDMRQTDAPRTPAASDTSPVMSERHAPPTGTEVADLLERAASRLEKPGAWTQGKYARAASGRAVGPRSPEACCWCAWGAMLAEAPISSTFNRASGALELRVSVIPRWNDTPGRSPQEVVAELRAAAADLRAA